MSKILKVTFIQCYAPTNLAEEENKEEFYNQLQDTLDRTTPPDILIVMGDMNAKVGKENTGKELVMGKDGLVSSTKMETLCKCLLPQPSGHRRYNIPSQGYTQNNISRHEN